MKGRGLFTLAVMLFASLGSSLYTFGRMVNRSGGSSSGGRQAFAVDFRRAHLKRMKYARARA